MNRAMRSYCKNAESCNQQSRISAAVLPSNGMDGGLCSEGNARQTENTRYNQEPILMLQKIVYCTDLKTFISLSHIVRIEVETKLDIKEIVKVKSGEGSS